MRLIRADIQNFRSIKNIAIHFEPRCRILVGINESGKSNILRALALLDTGRQVTSGDLRDFLPDEDPSQPAFVRFVFTLDRSERMASCDRARARVVSPNPSEPILSYADKKLSLEQFFDTRTEGLYVIDVRTGNRGAQFWRLSNKFVLVGRWKKPSPNCPPGYDFVLPDGNQAPLRKYSVLHHTVVKDVPDEYLADVELNDVNLLAGEEIAPLVNANLPECLYWSYSDSHLLPAQIPLDTFAANPSICEPLRHMFGLAYIEEIGTAIAEAKSRPNGIRNLLNRVADRATKHMRSVWKEYRGIKIELAQNGPNIEASVKDEFNLYDFARRSDGFKRFISFLTMVSARVRTQELVNTLYLHDEPDASLHPSGSRYLRDELIKISKDNYVLYSTHSIFMIDRELLRRHLIVEKQGEITEVREVDESNITDEEVIYNALGYSIFENLKRQNIIFEGWRDKRLYQVALRGVPTKYKVLKSAFADVGICHARGVKDIGRITPLLELADRMWVVVSDGDRPAVEHQRQYDGEGPWFRYDELLPDSDVLTGEDFIKPDAFRPHILAVRSENPVLPELGPDELANGGHKLQVIRKWLQHGALHPDEQKGLLQTLKERLFDDLKPSQIDERYYKLLAALAAKVQSQNNQR